MIYSACKRKKITATLSVLLLTVLAALLFSGSFPLRAAGVGKDKEKKVTVAYYLSDGFQEGGSDTENKSGYCYDFLQKIANYTGWKYSYVYGGRSDLYDRFLNGEIDLMAGIFDTDENAGQMLFSDEKIGTDICYLYVRTGDESVDPADFSTLNGKKIGTLKNDVKMNADFESWREEKKISSVLVEFDSVSKRDVELFTGMVDCIVASENSIGADYGLTPVIKISENDLYLCVSKKSDDPGLIDRINEAMTDIAANSPYFTEDLHQKYYRGSAVNMALSEAEKEWLDAHDTLKVGYLDSFLPFCAAGADGQVTGVITDILGEIAEQLRITKRFSPDYLVYSDYGDMIRALREGEVDVIFPVFDDNWYSEQNGIIQTAPVLSSSIDLVSAGGVIEEATRKIAVNKNNLMQYRNTVQFYPDAEIVLCDSITGCFNKVSAGLAGSTLVNGLRTGEVLDKNVYPSLNSVLLPDTCSYCFGIRAGETSLVLLMDRGISALDDNFAFVASYDYVGGDSHYELIDFVREHIVLVVATLVLIVALITMLLLGNILRTNSEKKKDAAAAKALSEALVAAQSANVAKTAFLNNMSHDIRTPMNAIIGYTALARAHADNSAQVSDYLAKIGTSSDHLLSLINDVLDMSRIESGKVRLEKSTVHLPDILHELRTITQANVNAKQLDLFIDAENVRDEDVFTDKLRLNQVLLNILGNAIKFTPAGGSVSLRLIQRGVEKDGMADYEFRIKDTGIGMSQEFKEHIFESFSREQNATVSGIQGTGLGMAITKNIVDLMEGSIAVESEQGKGTEFIVSLRFELSGKRVSYEELPDLEGKKVLVVDDDTNTCLSVSKMLEEIGMIPEWTTTGKEAAIRAGYAADRNDEFSVYLIDWIIPDLGGIEVVRRIREIVGNEKPIIIMSAYDWTEIETEARAAGVTGFCSKPLFMSELRQTLVEPYKTSAPRFAEQPANDFPDFSGKKILLVEDNQLNREIAEEILSEAGFVLETAEDGDIAVKKMAAAQRGDYDVILMDIQMPRMDGYEATGRIRCLPDSAVAAIPIIAMTANAFEDDKKKALEAGMDGHISKPVDIKTLMETLKEVLK